jgi:UDP-N-acetylmuramyl pentapeptide synthase
MKRTIGVVGNLAELDEDMKETAGYVVENIPEKLTDLFLSGDTGKILYPMIKNKYPKLNIAYTDNLLELIENLCELAREDVVIGIKGSRTAHLERTVYALKGRMPGCDLRRCGKLMMCSNCNEL